MPQYVACAFFVLSRCIFHEVESTMNKLARHITIAISVGIVAFLLWYFSEIVWYIVISAVLSIVGKPLVYLLMRIDIKGYTMPRWLAASVTLVVIWAAFLLFFFTMIPLVSSQFHDLSNVDFDAVMNAFSNQIDKIDTFVKEKMPSAAGEFSLRTELTTYFARLVNAASFKSLFASTASFVTELFVLLFSVSFITFFFLKEDGLFEKGLSFFFPKQHRESVHNAMTSVNKLLIRYFVGLIIQSTIILVLTAAGLWICGLPLKASLTIGVISGILNVIPYVGAVIAFVVAAAMVVALAVSNTVTASIGTLILLAGIVFLVVRLIDNILLQPVIFASSAKAHPMEIFLVLLMAGYMAGVLGMLLAIPAYIVLRVFAKEFFNNLDQVRMLTERM